MNETANRIVVCIDGTWEDRNGSTVHRISQWVETGGGQSVCYCAGPGTRFGSYLLGGLICVDARHILGVCRDHIRAHRGTWCDIHVFGFSRGAFLARVLCDMAAREGVHIRFLGCLDTVAATPLYDKRDFIRVPANVAHAFHAVALNEARALYDYLPMRGRQVRERFFAGCHGDIGGTYRDHPQLGNLALKWILAAAVRQGLVLSPEGLHAARATVDCTGAQVHDSLAGPSLRRAFAPSRLHASVARLPFAVCRRVAGRLQALRSDEIARNRPEET